MPEAEDPPPHDLVRLIRNYEAGGELVIAADCNAHHVLWGNRDNNRRGELLVEFLMTTSLDLLNVGVKPTFVTRRSQTIIDLTFATCKAAELITGWHVSDEASCSDHRWIRFDMQVTIKTIQPRRNPRKTDKVTFLNRTVDELLQAQLSDAVENEKHIEEQVTKVTNILIKNYNATCPLSLPSTHRSDSKSWWGPELERLRKKVRRLHNRAMNTRIPDDWDKYREARSTYKKRIRFRKTQSWRNFCESVEKNQQANRVRKVLASQPNQEVSSLRKGDGTLTNSPEEIQQILLRTHFPDCRLTKDFQWEDIPITPTESSWRTAREVVTPAKVKWAINSFQPYKAAGPDGIFPALLQWCVEPLVQPLSNIYRACLAYRYIPKAWREVQVIFIPKPGKGDYTDAKSFRPISLTSFLLKTLERLCDRELRGNALRHIPLHSKQHAYSPGKSTESALHQVVSTIEGALQNKGICLGTFIDIEGAFDKTNFSNIHEALCSHGVDITLVEWIDNMLRKRTVRFGRKGTQKAVVARGCPQGGVLSPLIWNLVVNKLITTLNDNHFYTVGYADDLAIMTTGKFADTVCDLTQTALRITEKWCRSYGLTINPAKTVLVMFTNKRVLGNYKLPKLANTELQMSTQVKYLGVTLDNKLSWNKHLEDKSNKASIIFWQCHRLMGKKWGLSPKISLWLYTAVIRPILSYGAVVWWPRTKLHTVVNKLQSFQRLACMAVTGCMRTTPTAALEAMLSLTPLHLFIKQAAALAATRLKSLNLWTTKASLQEGTHTDILNQVAKQFPLMDAPSDKIPPTYIFDKKYKIQLTEVQREGLNLHELRIFTDGSKTDVSSGAGVFSEDLNIKISWPLGTHNTVFQAECVGIILATGAVLARKVTNQAIRILTDSRSVLLALQSNRITSSLIYECHSSVNEVCKSNSVTLQWIKGHSESRGNDAADELARRASGMAVLGPVPAAPLPKSWLPSQLRKYTTFLHNQHWTDRKDCRQSRLVLQEVDPRFSCALLRLNRRQLRIITGAVTGHGPFNKHLFNIGITDSPLCRACMESEETAAHVIIECKGVENYRVKYLGNPRALPEAFSDVSKLLGFLEELGWQE